MAKHPARSKSKGLRKADRVREQLSQRSGKAQVVEDVFAPLALLGFASLVDQFAFDNLGGKGSSTNSDIATMTGGAFGVELTPIAAVETLSFMTAAASGEMGADIAQGDPVASAFVVSSISRVESAASLGADLIV